jgi:hypothetical protein
MTNIFTLENIKDFSEKINIDDLYEKKKERDLNNLELFNKILNRVHVRIKTTSRQQRDQQFCWYVVPEIIIGVPKYDQGACIAYLIYKLKDNGFNIKYINPNTLFICWATWVPSYIRSELKKKTGIVINEYGIKVEDETDSTPKITNHATIELNELVLNMPKQQQDKQQDKGKKEYKPIQSYKPSGNLIYDNSFFEK